MAAQFGATFLVMALFFMLASLPASMANNNTLSWIAVAGGFLSMLGFTVSLVALIWGY